MSDFVVYGVPGSPYLRTVLLALEEKGASWRLVPMVFGTLTTPEHLARHPFGRIPVLDHGDFRLYETQAILRYLDRILPSPALTPADPRQEARMNQVIGITDCYVMPYLSMAIAFQRLVAPMFGLPTDAAAIEAAGPRAEVTMAELARLLGDQPFMAGDAVSLADLMLIPHLEFFAHTPEGAAGFERHPSLAGWVQRLQARPSLARTTRERLLAGA